MSATIRIECSRKVWEMILAEAERSGLSISDTTASLLKRALQDRSMANHADGEEVGS